MTRRLAALRKSVVKTGVAGPGAGAASGVPGRPRDRPVVSSSWCLRHIERCEP